MNPEQVIEGLSGKLRDEYLNSNAFAKLVDVKEKSDARKLLGNQRQPRSSLGYERSAEFATVVGTSLASGTSSRSGVTI